MTLDKTHDPALRSWVATANEAGSDFTIQNLPLGMIATGAAARPAVAIGDRVLDLRHARDAGYLSALPADLAAALDSPELNALFALGRPALATLRSQVSALLRADSPTASRAAKDAALAPLASAVEIGLPIKVGDYTDFYASIDHATNVGSMFRPDNPLLPNYRHVPIGYHGRASSIVASGAPVRRPQGQTSRDPQGPPSFGASERVDYELELGAVIGRGNALGSTIPIAEAEAHLAGLVLLNDWSARDIQAWEYQPLGPFLAKNFASTISPWVVTLDALEPFRMPARPRADGEPQPLPYLSSAEDRERGGYAIDLEAWIQTARMRDEGHAPERLSRGTFARMYWTFAQMLTHHASNGCNLRAGDLLGSGTVSGPERDSRGCLLELAWKGTEPVVLANGERRAFVADGDEVILRGWCERPGAARIGFGECRATILPVQRGTSRTTTSICAIVIGAVLGCAVPGVAAAQGGTDVWVAAFNEVGTQVSVGRPLNVTRRAGYDNQPSFSADGHSVYYTSIREDAPADIWRVATAGGAPSRVTDTPESEYSALLTPDRLHLSVIRVERDSTQRLWKFPLDGGSPSLVLGALRPVGYHVWIDDYTLGTFVLGSPNALVVVDVRTEHADTLARGIGRALVKVPGRDAFSFVQHVGDTAWISDVDVRTRTVTRVASAPAHTEYHVWTPAGQLIIASGSRLWIRVDGRWDMLTDFAALGVHGISRLALSPSGDRLAFVAEDAVAP